MLPVKLYCLFMSSPVPLVAPTLGNVIRISAHEIQVTWTKISEDGEAGIEVTGYLVKYHPIPTIQKRNTEDLSIEIATNQTSLVITKLDPRISYGVSVAARNRAGHGLYSDEFVVERKLWK